MPSATWTRIRHKRRTRRQPMTAVQYEVAIVVAALEGDTMKAASLAHALLWLWGDPDEVNPFDGLLGDFTPPPKHAVWYDAAGNVIPNSQKELPHD